MGDETITWLSSMPVTVKANFLIGSQQITSKTGAALTPLPKGRDLRAVNFMKNAFFTSMVIIGATLFVLPNNIFAQSSVEFHVDHHSEYHHTETEKTHKKDKKYSSYAYGTFRTTQDLIIDPIYNPTNENPTSVAFDSPLLQPRGMKVVQIQNTSLIPQTGILIKESGIYSISFGFSVSSGTNGSESTDPGSQFALAINGAVLDYTSLDSDNVHRFVTMPTIVEITEDDIAPSCHCSHPGALIQLVNVSASSATLGTVATGFTTAVITINKIADYR